MIAEENTSKENTSKESILKDKEMTVTQIDFPLKVSEKTEIETNNEETDTGNEIKYIGSKIKDTDSKIKDIEMGKAIFENGLDLLSNKHKFDFCIVNMEEIKRGIRRGNNGDIQNSNKQEIQYDNKQEIYKGDNSYLSALSQSEKDYYSKLKLEKRKIQWIAGRYAVKSALLKYLIKSNRPDYITDLSYLDLRSSDKGPGIGPESEDIDNFDLRSFGLCNIELSNKYLRNIDILKGQDSAPYILQYNDINCSITHSYPFCIGVVSDKKIGIDIERIIPLRKSVIHYFYSEGEKGIIEDCKSEDEYARKSISFWTRKEAVSKVLRLGMKMNFRELDTAEDTVYFHYLKNGVINISTFHSNAFCLSIAVER